MATHSNIWNQQYASYTFLYTFIRWGCPTFLAAASKSLNADIISRFEMDGCLTFLVALRITTWSFVCPGFVGGYSWLRWKLLRSPKRWGLSQHGIFVVYQKPGFPSPKPKSLKLFENILNMRKTETPRHAAAKMLVCWGHGHEFHQTNSRSCDTCSSDLQELPCNLPFEVGDTCWMVVQYTKYTKAPLAWWSVHTDWIRDSRGPWETRVGKWLGQGSKVVDPNEKSGFK